MRERRANRVGAATVEPVTYVLDENLPAPLRERVLELLGSGQAAPAMRELARVLSVAYPHAAHALRRKLWELDGRAGGVPPTFGLLPLVAPRAMGYEPTRDYSFGPLGYGTGPHGLDRSMSEALAGDVRQRLMESPARVQPETDYPAKLASFADELDRSGFPLAAEVVRSKANYCKRQLLSRGCTTPMSFTYRLDPELPADVRAFVEWCMDSNRRPEQLEAVADHFGRGYAWTGYQLRSRAHQLRTGAA